MRCRDRARQADHSTHRQSRAIAQNYAGLLETRSTIDVYGDLLLRYENSARQDDVEDRNRESVHFRLGFAHPINEQIELGARLVTGNADDPNSVIAMLDGFFDDFSIALD